MPITLFTNLGDFDLEDFNLGDFDLTAICIYRNNFSNNNFLTTPGRVLPLNVLLLGKYILTVGGLVKW